MLNKVTIGQVTYATIGGNTYGRGPVGAWCKVTKLPARCARGTKATMWLQCGNTANGVGRGQNRAIAK